MRGLPTPIWPPTSLALNAGNHDALAPISCLHAFSSTGCGLNSAEPGFGSSGRSVVRWCGERRVRQGVVVRAGCRKVCVSGRRMRDGSKGLHCAQEEQELSAGLRLQRQDLFERLFPTRLPDSEISRWEVLNCTSLRTGVGPLFRHIIAYKLPWSCFGAGAGLSAQQRAR